MSRNTRTSSAIRFLIATVAGFSLLAGFSGPAHANSEPINDAITASAGTGSALDARFAAQTSGHIGVQSTWYSGTVCPRCTQTWLWNNAPADRIYAVGYSPVGASTTQPCMFQTTSTKYVQQPGGEREFWFTTKNIGSLACATDILLTSVVNGVGAWPTGGLDPGATATKHWNNANPLTTSYVVGLAPSGATSQACQLQVTRTWYQQQPGGEREFWFTIRNIGGIACQANILLAGISSTVVASTGTRSPGSGATWHWNNANPLNNTYVVGASPQGATTSACQFEVTNTWYQQVINPPAEREFYFTLTNVGAISCRADILLASLAS